MKSTFLSAEWRKLIMVNFEIEPSILMPYLPAKTEIDFWNQKTYVSIVGFMFLNTKVMGLKIPFHINFEEVNLRFYVRHQSEGEWRRGVTFIKEIVPKPAIAAVANWVYQENYIAIPMKHQIVHQNTQLSVQYAWKFQKKWNYINVFADNTLQELLPNSEEEFIAEHYWGYAKSKNTTVEYQVTHPKWQIYPVKHFEMDIDFGKLYGNEFATVLSQKPASVFLAEGSEIAVLQKNLLKI